MVARVLVMAAGLFWGVVGFAAASQWYVAPGGTPSARGTLDSPWDLESALDGRQKVAPGDTVWLLGGKYEHPSRESGNLGFTVRLSGVQDKAISVPVAGEFAVFVLDRAPLSPPQQ